MPRWADEDDDWDDDGPADADEDLRGDDEPTVPCPYCRRPIFEDAVRCPHCENYVSREDAPPSRKPWWILLGVAVCLYAVYRWVVG
jgi:hypothetical protein